MWTHSARYLHVTFADKLNLSTPPVNFAPVRKNVVESNESTLQGEDREFMRWLLECAGVNVSHYRPASLARRLHACLRILRANSTVQARAILERNQSLLPDVISAVLIGVTSFFRDNKVFDDLDTLVLSRLAERASARVWSIGCSEGMELYSVAMLLAERRVLHRCVLLGTDCRIGATRVAAAGVFPHTLVDDVPPRLRDKYLTVSRADANSRVLNLFIRAQIQWRTADVMTTPEPGPWDLILCRNMGMYMRAEAASHLWRILEKSLRPGGYLVLGKAERPHGAGCLAAIAPCIHRRER